MAILWADSFEHYGNVSGGRNKMLTGAWAEIEYNGAGGASEISIVDHVARTGTQSLLIRHGANSASFVRRVFGAPKGIIGFAVGVYFTSLPTVSGKIGFELRDSGNNNLLRATIQTDGSIAFYKGAGKVFTGSTDPVIGAASFSHIEVKTIFDDIIGQIEIRVNGIQAFIITNQNLGSVEATQIAIGCFEGGVAAFNMYIDDIVAWDNDGSEAIDFIGPVLVNTAYLVSDTAQADWAKVGAASGFDCVNDTAPDDDATYLTATNAGEKSQFGLGALPSETRAILGVYIPIHAKLDGAGLGRVVVGMKSGATVEVGAEINLTPTYTYWGTVFSVDPATGAAWTAAGLEAALVQIEKAAV